MVLHAGPGDQHSGMTEPEQPVGWWGQRGWCTVWEGRGGAVLSHISSHNPTHSVPSGLSGKRISWISRGSEGWVRNKGDGERV